jgi:hypothetical protein
MEMSRFPFPISGKSGNGSALERDRFAQTLILGKTRAIRLKAVYKRRIA